jgi:hypothetical protein
MNLKHSLCYWRTAANKGDISEITVLSLGMPFRNLLFILVSE